MRNGEGESSRWGVSQQVNNRAAQGEQVGVVVGVVLLALGGGLLLLALATGDGLQEQPAAPGAGAIPGSTSTPTASIFAAPPTAPATPTAPPPPPTTALVVVHITGAVYHSDVYRLPNDARVIDAVRAAGGTTPEADTERVNLAAHICDAEHIHIPRRGEPLPPGSNVCAGTSNAALSADTGPASPALVNLNTASRAELESLPEIGPALAQRIIDYRTRHGSFASVNALQQVPGIGPETFAALHKQVYVTE